MMPSHHHRLLPSLGLWLTVLLAPAVIAQDVAEAPATAVTGDVLEAKIAETESATDLAEETKNQLLSLYRRAQSNLQEAAADRASAQAFRQALQTAPGEAQAIRDAMDAASTIPSQASSAVSDATSLHDLETLLQQKKADFASADAQREDLAQRLDAQAARPAAIRKRLQQAEAEQNQNQAQQELAPGADESPTAVQARRCWCWPCSSNCCAPCASFACRTDWPRRTFAGPSQTCGDCGVS